MKNNWRLDNKGISLLEVLVATAVFLLFAIAIYGGINLIFKIVYNSRLRILETAILSENLETVRNLPFDQVGILNGIPSGVLPYSQTTTRNGIDFNIITTVRNIDDPFDGTVTSTDTSPADYKLVEMSIICANCLQTNAVILSTRVSPKGLEGASDNGSLFIHVFDANGLDVTGANINVVYTATATPIIINDTTDNNGYLRIIDTPTGTESYHITVTKSGYSSDYTVTSSVFTPIKSPSTVISQAVTEISFAIDTVGSINLTTMNPSCSAIAGASFHIYGQKVIGSSPTTYKYDQSLVTNGSGQYNFNPMEWDNYTLSTTNTSYDTAGTIPILPINLVPGASQDVSLILRTHTTNSLLVTVRDAGTQQPLSNATVHLTKGGYDSSVTTSVGYLRQTDWVGGSGQVNFTDETRYFADNSNVEINSPAGSIELKKIGNTYQSPGWLESSSIDIGDSATYRNIIWEPLSQPVSTTAKFQIATSNSSTPSSWDYMGPDGTTTTYYTATSSLIYSGHDNDRYLRYKVFMDTTDTAQTPQVSEVLFTYTNQCTPPGQAFFNSLSSGNYTLEVSRDGYDTQIDTALDVTGNILEVVDLSVTE